MNTLCVTSVYRFTYDRDMGQRNPDPVSCVHLSDMITDQDGPSPIIYVDSGTIQGL